VIKTMALKSGQPEILVEGDGQSQGGCWISKLTQLLTRNVDLSKKGELRTNPVTSVHWHGTFGSLTFRLFRDKLASAVQLPCG
jgi:hypothetical protein